MKFQVASGDTLTAVCAAAVTTVNPVVKVDYLDSIKKASDYVALDGTTVVTLVTGTVDLPIVTSLSLHNSDTGAITVTFKHVVGGTSRIVAKFTLQVGDTLIIDGLGARVLDVNGAVKGANAATVATVLGGPFTQLIGASTVAAGSTYADAGALPAGTASFYPTTAADDTKGVILNVADQVTGRTIDIGNGVSNKILKVYAPAGGTINGAAANAAFSSDSGKGVRITCLDGAANTWRAA